MNCHNLITIIKFLIMWCVCEKVIATGKFMKYDDADAKPQLSQLRLVLHFEL